MIPSDLSPRPRRRAWASGSPISRAIVENHGGRLVRRAARRRRRILVRAAAGRRRGGRGVSARSVFVVDDDAAVRDSIALLLSLKGYATRTFAQRRGFPREPTVAEWPGCLVLDLRMPGMGGLALQATLAERGIELPIDGDHCARRRADDPPRAQGRRGRLHRKARRRRGAARRRRSGPRPRRRGAREGGVRGRSRPSASPASRRASAPSSRWSARAVTTARSPRNSASARARSRSTRRV